MSRESDHMKRSLSIPFVELQILEKGPKEMNISVFDFEFLRKSK